MSNALYPPLRAKLENGALGMGGALGGLVPLTPAECRHVLGIADRYDELVEASTGTNRAVREFIARVRAS